MGLYCHVNSFLEGRQSLSFPGRQFGRRDVAFSVLSARNLVQR